MVKDLVATEQWAKAFSAARKFFFGLTKEQKRSIEIAADCGNEARQVFYTRLGVDWAAEIENAKNILLAKFG